MPFDTFRRWIAKIKKASKAKRARPRKPPVRLQLEQLEDRIAPALVGWDGGAGTLSWSDANNWDGNVLPGSADDVVISSAFASQTITSNSAVDVNSVVSAATLSIAGGTFALRGAITSDNATGVSSINKAVSISGGTLTGAGTVRVASGATFDWTAGTMGGSGKTVLAAGSTGTISGLAIKSLGRTLENAGTLSYVGFSLTFGPTITEAGIIDNLAGGTFNAVGDGDTGLNWGNANHAFINRGTFTRSGTGDTRFGGVRFDNIGSVDVQQGVLALTNGGTSSGSFGVGPASVLRFESGTYMLTSTSSVTGAGEARFIGGSIVDVNGSYALGSTLVDNGTVNFNGASATLSTTSLTVSGGTLGGAGTVTVTSGGTFSWTGGTMSGTGKTALAAGATGTISGNSDKSLGRTLENAGTLSHVGNSLYFGTILGEAGVIDNQAGGTFNAHGNLVRNYAADHAFINQGTFTRSGTGSTSVASIRFDNSGLVDVQEGTLNLHGDGTSSGSYQVAGGSTLYFGGSTLYVGNGTHSLSVASSISGAGTARFGGGTVNVNGFYAMGATLVDSFGGTVNFNGASPNLGTGLTISGGMANIAGNTSLNSLTIAADGLGRGGTLGGSGIVTVVSGGTFSWTAGTMSGTGKTVLAAGSTGTISGNSDKSLGRTLENAGTLSYLGASLYFGTILGEAGVIDNLAGGTFNAQGDGDLVRNYVANHAFINRGTFTRSGTGGTNIAGIRFENRGTVDVQEGTLGIVGTGSVSIDGTANFTTGLGASIRLEASLLGSTVNADNVSVTGKFVFAGGSAGAPRLWEVMGNDLGATASGFDQNFAYGTVELSSAYVRLVDNANNSSGSTPEAIYVDSLLVPAGSTLDLNGLHLYSRITQIAGTVINGTVIQVLDGGAVALDFPMGGTIAALAEVDEWTFFGRAGEFATVMLATGSASSPTPLTPHLNQGQIHLVDPSGNILASATNSTVGGLAELLGIALPVDGTYKVRVSAAPASPTSTGNYRLTVWNSTVDQNPVVINQNTVGQLENPFSIDRWTFSGNQNQQLVFDLLNADSPAIRFKLSGPNGYVGFNNLAADSDPLTLPADGAYTLEVFSNGTGSGSYAFRLAQLNETVLTLGTSYNGTLVGSGNAQLFKVTVAEGNPMRISLDDANNTDLVEIYASLGSPPTRQQFDYRSEQAGADHQLQIPFAAPGTWYILVYGATVVVPSAFTLQVQTETIRVTGTTPDRYAVDQTVALTISGAGFVPGVHVHLVAGAATFAAQSSHVDGFDQLTATFNLTGVPQGVYDVRVTLPSGASHTLAGAFSVLPAGVGKLETRIVLPSVLGPTAVATLYVEYANTGTAALAAPILVLQSADANNSDLPLLTLDQSLVAQGFWTSADADGFDNSVQIYATGNTPGYLMPGESFRVPVYYVGLQGTNDGAVEFEIRIHDANNTETIPWDALRDSLRPSWIEATAWSAVFDNLAAQVGTTWGDYIQMLADNAIYLHRLGQRVTSVNELYSFEIQQAFGISAISTLASAVDAALSTPGLSLAFARSFGNTITERYELGAFGYGWSAPWLMSLVQEADGTVVVKQSADSQRRFQPDRRQAGTYFSQNGDTGVLRQVSGGAFELTETSGLVTRFLSSGQLDYIQDVNDNRITAGFTAGMLTSLTHSSGAALTITYSGERIASIADSSGRTTTFTYDASNTHLLSATGPAGTTTYTYSTDTGPRAHALTSVTEPGSPTRFFEYDLRGRLVSTFVGSNIERVNLAYDEAGMVTITDGAGISNSLFFDHRGLVVRTEDGLGNYITSEYDADGRLAKQVNSLGHARSFTWCDCGTLKSVTDELGHTNSFTLGGPRNQPTAFIDANGNTTRYAYDDDGNLTSTTYADGSVERVAYDALGNATTLTNRRGQAIQLTYNAAGQVIEEEFPDGTSNLYEYDTRGRLTKATDSNGDTLFTYDVADRLTRVDYPTGRWLSYTYDAAGRRTRLQGPDGYDVKYLYDAAGRLSGLRDGANADALIVDYIYDSAGRMVRENKGNGTFSTYEYDAASRVTKIEHHRDANTLNSFFIYEYDALGHRTSMDTIDGKWTYTYDLTGQLTRAVFASTNVAIANQDLNYEYDAMGNRVRTVLNGATTNYSTNGMNQYTQVGSNSNVYDLDGNLIQEIGPDGTRQYTYDALNRLMKLVTPEGTWQYEYDAFGNRVATVVDGERTDYLLDPTGMVNVVGDYGGTGVRTSSFAFGDGLEAAKGSDGWHYYDFDALGSTAGMNGSNGTYLNRYVFQPFGDLLLTQETVNNAFQYIGQFGVAQEGNSLSFMRSRFYYTLEGRFTSPDPSGLTGGQWNVLTYAGNNPIILIDPLGLRARGELGSFF